MPTPEVTPFPSASTNIGDVITRYSSLPTPTDMRQRSLFGLPLKSQFTGEEVNDSTLQHYIDESISEVEHELDLYISPVTFSERHDFSREMNMYSFGYLKLNHTPIITVNKFEVSFNNGQSTPPLVSLPVEFIHVQSQEGTVQIVPAMGVSLTGYISSVYSSLGFQLFNSAMMTTWPGAVTVEYIAGFPDDKVPGLLVGLIENLAAYKFLSSLGPILFPFSSVGVSIDGASQSTSTPGPAFLQQRLAELEKLIQAQKEAARGHYQKRFLLDYL